MPDAVPASATAPGEAQLVAPAVVAAGKVAYRRLPGRAPVLRFGLFSAPGGSLHFGPDHLLKVETGAIHETYKRFAFREIAAITLVRTNRWHWLTGVAIGMILLIFLVALIVASQASGGAYVAADLSPTGLRTFGRPTPPWGIAAVWAAGVAVPFIVLFGTNLLRGPTCRVTLHTALGPEPLPTLGRLRVAVPVVREIAAAAEQAQGALPADALATRLAPSVPPSEKPRS